MFEKRPRGRPQSDGTHRGRIRRSLREEGPATVAELARRVGMTEQHVAVTLSGMKARGEVIASRYKRYGNGERPYKIYQLAPDLPGGVLDRYDPTLRERLFLLELRVAQLEAERGTTSAPTGLT